MPIYEYECGSCKHRFELLVQSSAAGGLQSASSIACPRCGGTELEKQFSVFATSVRDSSSAAPSPCGSCGDPRGPGACSRFNG